MTRKHPPLMKPIAWFEENARNQARSIQELKNQAADLQDRIDRSQKSLTELIERIVKAEADGKTHLPV